MPDEQHFMCRACFREHQEQKKRQQEARMRAARHRCCDRLTRSRVAPRQERDKLRLAKMMKFGDKVRSRRMLSHALRCPAWQLVQRGPCMRHFVSLRHHGAVP